MDAEWGHAMRLNDVLPYPWNMTLGAIQDQDLIFQIGNRIGEQAKKLGIHMNYSPVLDINTNPLNPIIGNRSFGETEKIVSKISHDFFTAIDKSSTVDKNSKIGLGSVIAHNSVIQSDVQIGKHCIINTSSSVDHDCKVDDFVHVGPGVTICGNVKVGSCSLIGAGSIILPNIKIGKNVIVGAGSVVLKDIPDNAKVVGSPAKKLNDE